MNFLTEPYIDRGNKIRLASNTVSLLQSPISFDPYGLQQSVFSPLLTQIVFLENEKIYLARNLKKMLQSDRMNDDRYILRLLHICHSIQWMKTKNQFPPLNILTLCADSDMWELVVESLNKIENPNGGIPASYIKEAKKFSQEFFDTQAVIYTEKNYDFDAMTCNRRYVENAIKIIDALLMQNPYIHPICKSMEVLSYANKSERGPDS